MMTSKQIINDIKSNFNELNYTISYQDDLPVKMVGTYESTPIFTVYFSDGTIDFETVYKNISYKNYIKPEVNDAEKFLIESSGVSFYYYMNRSLIKQLIPKLILALKNYYINNRMENLEYDFKCRR
ncbi:MAG: hypothetical protein J6T10_04430 [Methanobrevibacter sp.]|nr:hypothetical protein [Methanobrevibacter sp.]